MDLAKKNVAAGGAVIVIAGLGGLALGATYDDLFRHGYYQLTLTRAFLKAGHSHGMALALYNLILGPLLGRLALSERARKWCSWLGLGALIMPLGLVLRGLTQGSMLFAPLGFLGGLCFMASVALVVKGAWRARPQ